MRRGEIWTIAGGKDYAGKLRPVVIVRNDSLDATNSITICAFTTDPTEAPLIRISVEAKERNGLRTPRRLMVDKITTVPNSKAGARIGRLDDEDILRLNRAIVAFSWARGSLESRNGRGERVAVTAETALRRRSPVFAAVDTQHYESRV